MANERNAGRKLKYGEKTAFITKRVPESKAKEIETKFDAILETYKIK